MDIDKFNTLYSNIVEKISFENKQIVLMGDFNIDLLNTTSCTAADEFLNNNLSHCLKPHITCPTRVTYHSKTLIDNIFSNIVNDPVQISGNLICAISDHLPQILVIKSERPKLKKTLKFYQDFSNFNKEDFLLDFLSIDWDELLQNKSPESTTKTFKDTINENVLKHAPIKKSKSNQSTESKPWITSGIKKSIISKNRLYKSFLKAKSPKKKMKKEDCFKNIVTSFKPYLERAKKTTFRNTSEITLEI